MSVRWLVGRLHIHHNPLYPCHIAHEPQANHHISKSIVKLCVIKMFLLPYENVKSLNRFINWINKAEQHGLNSYDIKEDIFSEIKVEPYSKTI